MKPSTKTTDFLIIGGGVAGLRAAIELATKGDVLLLTKDKPNESSTGYAQGGIAVALSDEDEVCIHYDDTVKAGSGLCNEKAVKTMVEEGPGYILELISWGAAFDREESRLSFTIEAAHTRKRILHSHGDSTGKEIERALVQKARSFPSISRYDFSFTLDLLTEGNRCIGARVLRGGIITDIYAKAVILATGGAGQVYARTTNPMISTGDGIAIAYRAGAVITDMEFVQFHPTTLYSPGAPQFLLSEAMRGEGAYLKNKHGERFMSGYDEMAELASRDTATRAIVSEMVKTGISHVYLDLTHLDSSFVKNRFPQIYNTCLQYNIDITENMIPVSPAAHYLMGGVSTNLDGETSIKGLFAAGEVACTGVHGANRLASNSLLEGLVFGARAGKKAAEYISSELTVTSPAVERHCGKDPEDLDIEKTRSTLRQFMWNSTGIIRCEKSLAAIKEWLESNRLIVEADCQNRRDCELKNMFTVAQLITDSSLLRKSSAGAHYRSDFKEKDKNLQKHTICRKGKGTGWSDHLFSSGIGV